MMSDLLGAVPADPEDETTSPRGARKGDAEAVRAARREPSAALLLNRPSHGLSISTLPKPRENRQLLHAPQLEQWLDARHHLHTHITMRYDHFELQ